MNKKLPELDSLVQLSDKEARKEIGKLPTSDERVLGEVLRGSYKVSNDETKELLTKLRESVWVDNNHAQSVLLALATGAEIRKIRGTINAANKRHALTQNLFLQACNFVELDLDYNNNPDWMHADYVNWILNKEKFNSLSRESLKKHIREIFRKRGLDNRISNSKAKEVKLIPKAATKDKEEKETEQTTKTTPQS